MQALAGPEQAAPYGDEMGEGEDGIRSAGSLGQSYILCRPLACTVFFVVSSRGLLVELHMCTALSMIEWLYSANAPPSVAGRRRSAVCYAP